jgi:membrane-associated protease RseP (regulator of RpoE activity)
MCKSLIVAAAFLFAACAVIPVQPSADRVARLPAYDQGVVQVEGELARLTATTQGDKYALGVVAMSEKEGKLAYTFVGPASEYRGGLLNGEPVALRAMVQARATSAYHQPVETKIGAGQIWCILDKVPKGPGEAPGHRMMLEMYDSDPRKSPDGLVPFAITELQEPAAEAKPRGYIGMVDAPLTPEAAQGLGLPARARGALVVEVLPGSPADQAGIHADDVVVKLGDKAVEAPEDFLSATAAYPPGTPVKVGLLRGKEHLELSATLASRADGNVLVRHNGTVVQAAAAWLDQDGKLSVVSLPVLKPSVDFLLQGKSSRDLWTVEDAPTEHILNDALVDRKNQELPLWLRKVNATELAKAVTMTEKGVLALDVSIRLLKDKIDAAARNNQEVPGGGEAEQLMEQRKMLLGVVLQAMKSAAAQKPVGG